DRFAVLPEVGLKAGYRLAPWLRATVGYNFLYLSSAVRQGEQVSRVVDVRQLPPAAAPIPFLPPFPFRPSDFCAQGFALGLAVSFGPLPRVARFRSGGTPSGGVTAPWVGVRDLECAQRSLDTAAPAAPAAPTGPESLARKELAAGGPAREETGPRVRP